MLKLEECVSRGKLSKTDEKYCGEERHWVPWAQHALLISVVAIELKILQTPNLRSKKGKALRDRL